MTRTALVIFKYFLSINKIAEIQVIKGISIFGNKHSLISLLFSMLVYNGQNKIKLNLKSKKSKIEY
jgi:hypothetical protein